MVSFSPVRSVERVLAILEHLNRNRVTTVRDLHATTGLPKPTIVRLLQTLEQTGYVSNDAGHGGYQVTSKITSLGSGFHGDPLVVEAGRAHAVALTKHIIWPTTIAILDGTHMVVRYSTIPDSPNSPFHATVNMQLTLDRHALGLAYLAFCNSDEQDILINTVLTSKERNKNRISGKEKVLRQSLRFVREQGFAERIPYMEPRSSNTIAVPIMGEERILGTLGITYFRAAYSQKDAAEKFVKKLHRTARDIAKNTRRLA
ncbi:MAG: transcriptional regulator [Blastopirellula sp.]|nr:MAG: transcriptional regulator [Blastopirellula sp.]